MSPAVRSEEVKIRSSECRYASSGRDASLEESCVKWDAKAQCSIVGAMQRNDKDIQDNRDP